MSFNLLQFETNTACNVGCTFCMHSKMRRHGSMPFTKIIDLTYHLAHKAKEICPFHMQEPLLDPRLDKVCSNIKLFNPKGIINIYTSMSVYPKTMLDNIVRWGLVDRWLISFYGGNKQLHNRMQPGAPYAQTARHIKRFIKMRNKYGWATPKVIMGYLVTRETYPNIKKFKKRWSRVADELTFWRWDSWRGTQPYDAEWEQKLWGEPAPRVPCNELYGAQYVHFDGSVVPCCQDYDDTVVLGNVFDNWDAWETSEKLQELRKLHEEARWSEIPLCKDCTRWRYNYPEEWVQQWLNNKKLSVNYVTSR